MKNISRKDIQEEIKQRSDILYKEIDDHIEEITSYHPELLEDKNAIINNWLITKIAGLQIVIEHLNYDLKALIKKSNSNSKATTKNINNIKKINTKKPEKNLTKKNENR